MTFSNEQALVDSFVSRLGARGAPWPAEHVATEFYYQRGRTDVVFTVDDSVIAVEAKLQDWRTAMHQAFRNRCFAHRSYVLLPKTIALKAHHFAGEFERRRVGICYLENSMIVVLHTALESDPIEPWLSQRAKQHIVASGSAA